MGKASARSPPLVALQAATRDGAVVFGLADQIGSVEVGKETDLVVLAAAAQA